MLESLGSRLRAVIVSHQSWATSVLSALAAYNIIEEEGARPVVVELSPIHRPSFESFLEAKGAPAELYPFFTEMLDEGFSGSPLIIHGIGVDYGPYYSKLRRMVYSVRVVFTTANKGLSTILRFPVYRLVHVRGRVFKVYRSGSRPAELVEINEEGIVPARMRGTGILREAYNVLLDAMAAYGELRVKDAVYVLMGNFGVDRRRAREILGKLVEEGRITVKKGVVMIK